jgi:hypothetical protein
MGATPRSLVIAFFSASLITACSPAKNAQAEATVKPQPDQVGFFERPATLAAVRASGGAVPVLVLLEMDPRAAVLGADSPVFALYRDGKVIWRRGDGFRTTRLSALAAAKLRADLDLDRLRPLYGYFEATASSDQPETSILAYENKKPTIVSVYGSMHAPEIRAKVPTAISHVFDRLTRFDHAGTAWLPEKVEVMIWPYDYAPEASVPWPKDLPDLDDRNTVKAGDSFSLFVPSARLQDVRQVLARRRELGAIEIGGKKWAAAIRFPFPAERLWIAPNSEAKRADN